MNNTLKNVIIFTSGAVIGSIATWLSVKTYYESKADSEIEEAGFMYHERLKELSEIKIDDSINNPEIVPEDGKQVVNGLEDTISSLSKGNGAKAPSKDYTSYFKKGEDKLKEMGLNIKGGDKVVNTIDPAEVEYPNDDEELDEGEQIDEAEDYAMYLVNEEHKQAVAEGRPPYIIDSKDFGTVPGYDTMDLFYYTVDNVLADENKEEVDAPELFVGDALDDGVWPDDSLESIIFRSDVTMTDVEVHRIDEKFYNE